MLQFANNTMVVGLFTNDNETVYMEEIRDLAVWCPGNNLSPQGKQDKGADCG
jgi:hypothetical protein